ncbi:MAG: universal stress protein [Streptosporangiaceae bacterium]
MAHSLTSRRIVVAIDGSAASAAAVRWAVREARLREATVHLVCAHHDDTRMRASYALWPSMAAGDDGYAGARAVLAAAEDLARQDLPPDRLTTELADKLPVRALLDRSSGAEMLVLGSTRQACEPGQPPPAIDPVARDCLSLASCPVVIVGPDPGEPSVPATTGSGRLARP